MIKFSFFLSFDYTVLCGILVLLAMSYSFIKSKGSLKEVMSIPVGFFIALAVLLLFGLSYTSAPNYGFEKSTRFAVLGFIAFSAPLFFSRDLKDVKQVVFMVFLAGMVIMVGTIIAPYAAVVRRGAGVRGGFLEASPLESAAMIATLGSICAYFCISSQTPKKLKIIGLIFLPMSVIGITLTGSRGPLIGLGLAILGSMVFCRKHLSKVWMPLLIIALVIATFTVIVKLPQKNVQRILSIFEEQYEFQNVAYQRTSKFTWVLSRAGKHIFLGNGTGSYAVDWGGQDERDYPHNIILELLYENGLAGVIIFVLFMWLVLKRWRAGKKFVKFYELCPETEGLINIAGLLLFFNILQSLKTYDIDGNRYMFFTCGLVLALYNCIKAECLNISFYDDELDYSSLSYDEAEHFGDELILYERL